MVDADIGFYAPDVVELLKMDLDFVCGAYSRKCVEWDGVRRAVLDGAAQLEEHASSTFVEGIEGPLDIRPLRGERLVEIRRAGTGFMLLRREVLTALAQSPERYSSNEILDTGHRFFGGVSRGLASVVERAFSTWGQPNGYVLGQEGGGAVFGGLRYGEGVLYTKNAGDLKVYWQGPTLGWDIGGDGARTMMLVYNLPRTAAIFDRFGGVAGSAYFVGGFGMTALTANNIVVVPIRSGLGLRLGANVGYLKFTTEPTWNPF